MLYCMKDSIKKKNKKTPNTLANRIFPNHQPGCGTRVLIIALTKRYTYVRTYFKENHWQLNSFLGMKWISWPLIVFLK